GAVREAVSLHGEANGFSYRCVLRNRAVAPRTATPGERSRWRSSKENSRGSANNRLRNTHRIWLAFLAVPYSTTPVSRRQDQMSWHSLQGQWPQRVASHTPVGELSP